MKIGIADHISIFSFLFFELGKGKRKLDYPIFIFHYGIGEWKTKGRYIQHVAVFRLSCFHLAKEKNENGYNRSYFYFSFFVWWLQKRKRMLFYSLSIFYYEIEKRKTKGLYIHGSGQPSIPVAARCRLWYITWINIIHDTNVFVPIPYMTATYHNIPHCLDGPCGPAHLAGPFGPLSWECGHTGKAVSEHYMILLYDHTGRNIHRSFN